MGLLEFEDSITMGAREKVSGPSTLLDMHDSSSRTSPTFRFTFTLRLTKRTRFHYGVSIHPIHILDHLC